MRRLSALLSLFVVALAVPTAAAQTPALLPAPLDLPAFSVPAAPSDDARRTIGTDTSAPTVPYQGVLSDGGAPVADGSYAVTVGLFGDATGGTAEYAETHTVTTVGGAFSLAIGGGTPSAGTYANVSFARETWVEVGVGGTTLGPRTLILAVPHARSLTAGAQIIGDASVFQNLGSALYVENTISFGSNYGVYGLSQSAGGGGVFGEAASTAAGVTVGVRGLSRSLDGIGVWGQVSATTGISRGLLGESPSTEGRGVEGLASASAGVTVGVFGMSQSRSGTGAYGFADASTGTTHGIYGQSRSNSGTGVYGTADATSGQTYGVYGHVNSPAGYAGYFTGGRGLYAEATDGRAGQFENDGEGFGNATVYAENASTGNGIAGWFETNGTDASLVAYQRGTGDLIRGIKNNNLRFSVKENGDVTADGTFTGGGADLAEYFPLAGGADVAPGQVVGLRGGRVSLATDGAEQIAVISSDPAFVGNPTAEAGGALVALVGQVEVQVSGDAAAGDLLIASGGADGRARAVSPAAYHPADGAVLGRVLSADGGRVTALVGVDEAAALRGVVARQADQIEALAARLARLEARLAPTP